MGRTLWLAGLLTAVSTGAQASIIDFTQPLTDFDVEPVNGWVQAFRLTDDGVTFSFFNPSSRGSPEQFATNAEPRLTGLAGDGLQIGGGGSSAFSFDFTVSRAVTLDAYTVDERLGSGLTMDLSDASGTLSGGNGMSADGTFSFAGAPISLAAGTTYMVTFGGTKADVVSAIEAFDFSVTAIPLPTGLPLLLGAVATLGLVRRRTQLSGA